jgi:hypothetical protein
MASSFPERASSTRGGIDFPVVRYRIESSASIDEPFIHVQDKPLRVAETFFHPPKATTRRAAGQGFWKVTSIEPRADDFDAIIKADRLETPNI